MAKGAQAIAKEINELMRKNGNECITLKWGSFTKFVREKGLQMLLWGRWQKA